MEGAGTLCLSAALNSSNVTRPTEGDVSPINLAAWHFIVKKRIAYKASARFGAYPLKFFFTFY